MNISGIIIGLLSFAIIGIFHPIVIKSEYYFGKRIWSLFLVVGLIACFFSVIAENNTLSALLAVIGFTSFWSIKELYEQEERVRKGWFPANPKKSYPAGKTTG
jgi:hypothetical protein